MVATDGPPTPTPTLPTIPPSPTSPTDPSSPMNAALLNEGFPSIGEEGDEEDEDEGALRGGDECKVDEEIEITAGAGSVDGEGAELVMPVPMVLAVTARGGAENAESGDIGLAVTTDHEVDMSDAYEDRSGSDDEQRESGRGLGLSYNLKIWDWSIGGLSNCGGVGNGLAGEMDGGVR